MMRIPGEQNLADHLTKGKRCCEIDEFVRRFGGQVSASLSNKEKEHNWKTCMGCKALGA